MLLLSWLSLQTEVPVASSSPRKVACRVFSWFVLCALVLTLVLALRKSPPPDVAYDPTAAARVEQKFAAADQPKAAGAATRVTLDSTELSSYLHDNLAFEGSPQSAVAQATDPDAPAALDPAAPSPSSIPAVDGVDAKTVAQAQSTVKDVKIDMEGDLIKAYVIFDFHSKDLSLELDGHLGTQDGYITFQPVAGKFGSLPLPQSALNAAVERLTSAPQNREALKLPPDISNIRIVDGHAVVTYK
jgi:hypothetical protein